MRTGGGGRFAGPCRSIAVGQGRTRRRRPELSFGAGGESDDGGDDDRPTTRIDDSAAGAATADDDGAEKSGRSHEQNSPTGGSGADPDSERSGRYDHDHDRESDSGEGREHDRVLDDVREQIREAVSERRTETEQKEIRSVLEEAGRQQAEQRGDDSSIRDDGDGSEDARRSLDALSDHAEAARPAKGDEERDGSPGSRARELVDRADDDHRERGGHGDRGRGEDALHILETLSDDAGDRSANDDEQRDPASEDSLREWAAAAAASWSEFARGDSDDDRLERDDDRDEGSNRVEEARRILAALGDRAEATRSADAGEEHDGSSDDRGGESARAITEQWLEPTRDVSDTVEGGSDRARDDDNRSSSAARDEDGDRWAGRIDAAVREVLEHVDDAEGVAAEIERRASELAERVEADRADEREHSDLAREEGPSEGDVKRWTERADAVAREVLGSDADVADAVRELVRDAVEFAVDRSGDDDVRRAVDAAREELHDAVETNAYVEEASVERLATGADGEPLPAEAVLHDGHTAEQLCAGGSDCGVDALRAREVSLLSSRGPPEGEQVHEYDADRDAEDGEWVDGEWVEADEREYDDSAERTERVLEGRIELDDSATRLADEEQKVASGEVTAEQHAKNKAEHDELTRRVEADRAELSPERVELVDEVIDGHRELSEREAQLAAEAQQVAAGAVDQASHDRTVAEFEAQRERVYEATDELMRATERDARVVPEDGLDDEGSVAGCGSDGAFVECGSVSESADGKRVEDRCVGLAGVSSGCGASSKSGENESSASCVLSGADAGCGSSASSRGADGEGTTASAHCSGHARACGQHSMATPDGAASSCESGAEGSCRSDSTGSRTDRAEAQLASATNGAHAAATGEARRQGSSTAHCEASTGCGTETSVDLGRSGEVVADAEVGCAAAAGCTGSAATSTDSSADADPRAQQTSAAAAATGGKADCSVSGGLCAARSSSAAESESGTAGDSDATVEVGCDAATCSGRGATATTGTATGGQAGATRDSSGQASCEAAGAGCEAYSSTQTDSEVRQQRARRTATGVQSVALVDGDASASSTAGASVHCDGVGCSGKAASATTGKVIGAATGIPAAAPVRETSGSANCDAGAGGCAIESTSQTGDKAAAPVSRAAQRAAAAAGRTLPTRELSATSTAGASVDCATTACTGSGSSTTSGAASGDVTGVRDSTGSSSCTARGAGGGCSTSTDTTVSDREAAKGRAVTQVGGVIPVTGPVSVSNAGAQVTCEGAATECGGTASSSTSARDTAVSPHARGTGATTECTVTGGGCQGETSSAASTAPDFVVTDPATGKPLAGQPLTGPSSSSSSSASLAC